MSPRIPLCPLYRFTAPVIRLNRVTDHRRVLLGNAEGPITTCPLPLPVFLRPPQRPAPPLGLGLVEDLVVTSRRVWACGVLAGEDSEAVGNWVGALRLGAAAFDLNLDDTHSYSVTADDRPICVYLRWRLTGLTARVGPPVWTEPGDVDITPMTYKQRRDWCVKSRIVEQP